MAAERCEFKRFADALNVKCSDTNTKFIDQGKLDRIFDIPIADIILPELLFENETSNDLFRELNDEERRAMRFIIRAYLAEKGSKTASATARIIPIVASGFARFSAIASTMVSHLTSCFRPRSAAHETVMHQLINREIQTEDATNQIVIPTAIPSVRNRSNSYIDMDNEYIIPRNDLVTTARDNLTAPENLTALSPVVLPPIPTVSATAAPTTTVSVTATPTTTAPTTTAPTTSAQATAQINPSIIASKLQMSAGMAATNNANNPINTTSSISNYAVSINSGSMPSSASSTLKSSTLSTVNENIITF